MTDTALTNEPPPDDRSALKAPKGGPGLPFQGSARLSFPRRFFPRREGTLATVQPRINHSTTPRIVRGRGEASVDRSGGDAIEYHPTGIRTITAPGKSSRGRKRSFARNR